MQNFSHNSNKCDDQSDTDKQDKSRQKNDIQREMVMQESDMRRVINEKNQLEAEISAFKKEEAHIKMNMQEKQERLNKVDFELSQFEATMKGLKKKLNLI